jgi:hypothetical protein
MNENELEYYKEKILQIECKREGKGNGYTVPT